MIYVRPFKAEDIKTFKPVEPIDNDLLADPELAEAIEKSGLAVTGYINGKIVCCGGVHPTEQKGQGEAWIRLSETCQKYPIATMRWIKAGLKIAEQTYPFKQLNAIVRRDCPAMIKMVTNLGFRLTQFFTRNDIEYGIWSKIW